MAEVHYRYTALTQEQMKILNLARKIGYKKVILFLDNLINDQTSLDFILKQPDSAFQTISELQVQIKQLTDRMTAIEKNVVIDKSDEKIEDQKKRRDWNDLLQDWTSPEIRELALEIQNRILSQFQSIIHGITGTEYFFSKGKKGPKNCFTILALRKKKLAIRVRFEPNNSIDPQNMLKEKVYKPWFFLGNGQERELQIDSITQIDNAMHLIAQSYSLT